MDLKQQFGIDPALAAEGVWIPVDGNGARLLICSSELAENPRFAAYLEPLYRRFRQTTGVVPQDLIEEGLARHVLIGWEGLEEDGRPLEPTEQNRLAMIRKYRRFKELVWTEANNFRNFQPREDERKN
jgi:hypothetical protein